MTEPAAPTRTEPELDSTTRADQSDELATTTLLRAAIGTVNTNYYLGIFSRFDAHDKTGPSWNTAAALATLNWMLYRRMWNAALAYVGIALTVALLVFGIGKLALHYSSEVQWALAALYALVLVLVPGFFGNALLFRQYRSDMARALSAHHTISEAAAMLAARAPSLQRLMVLGGLNLVVLAALAALVQWASGFNGLPTSLGTPSAATPVAVASGNVTTGRTIEAAAPTASAAASTPSAPQAAASAPQPVAPSAQAAVSAPLPQASASAPRAATSTPVPPQTAGTPQQAASTPPTASSNKNSTAPNAGRGNVQPTAPTTQATEKAEAAKLAPLATAQKREPATTGTAATAQKPAATAKAPAAAASAAPPSAPVTSKRKPATAPKAAVETGGGKIGVPAGSYGINVGLFADDNNARNAFVKLSDAGLAAYTQEIRGKKGKLTWVRVGPFDSVVQAEKAVEKIHALGLDAQVFKPAQ